MTAGFTAGIAVTNAASLKRSPKVFVPLRRRVPAIDATGLHALEELHAKCRRSGATLVLSGVHAQPMNAFIKSDLDQQVGLDNMFGTIDEALGRALEIVGESAAQDAPRR